MRISKIKNVFMYFFIIALTLPISLSAQLKFEKIYGGPGMDIGTSVCQTLDGGYIITGIYGYDDYTTDVYLIKTDANGDTLWTRVYGDTASDEGYSVQQTSDGGYIVAGKFGYPDYKSDIYLIRTDVYGDTLWTKKYGGIDYELSNSVQQTEEGGFIIAGKTNSFGAGGSDVFLIKTDASGDTVWTKTYGGTDDEAGKSVKQTSDEGYIIAGHNDYGGWDCDIYLIKTNSSGDTIWTKSYGGSDREWGHTVQQTSDEGYIIAGYTASFGAGSKDVYIIKTDTDGDTVWTRTYGGTNDDYGMSAQQTNDGGYIITGYTESFGAGLITDVWLIKTDAFGDTLWTRTYGGPFYDSGYCVRQTSDSGFVLAGYTSDEYFNMDVYLIKTDENGLLITGISDNNQSVPMVYGLYQNYPNPFNPKTVISYQLPVPDFVELAVYNLLGQRVRMLVNTNKPAGTYSVTWDGRNETGEKVASGIYIYQLEAGSFLKTRKMIFIK